jgi:hypothetical protein
LTSECLRDWPGHVALEQQDEVLLIGTRVLSYAQRDRLGRAAWNYESEGRRLAGDAGTFCHLCSNRCTLTQIGICDKAPSCSFVGSCHRRIVSLE